MQNVSIQKASELPQAVKSAVEQLLAHVCAFLRPSVRNPLKVQGRFSAFEKV